MDSFRDEERMGRVWIAAMIALVVLLVLGLIFYFRMSAPIREPKSRTQAPPLAAHNHGPQGLASMPPRV